MKKTTRKSLLVLVVVGLVGSCGKSDRPTAEKILARIGPKTITEGEFIRRAEYTIRPGYCKNDTYIHKKIILNSLIAEKLFALEAGEDNELTRNEEFQLFLQGRKEQAMRQWLYYKDFYNKVEVDSQEVYRTYDLSRCTYKIAYYTIKDTSILRTVEEKLTAGRTFEEIFRDLGGLQQIPEREVSWDRPEPDIIKQAFFNRPLQKDEVLGPLQVEKNFYLLVKVLGWRERVLLGGQQTRQRLQDVADGVQEFHAQQAYKQFVTRLMRGKTVRFNPTSFRKVVELMAPFYMKSAEDREKAFNKRFWQQKDGEQIPTTQEAEFEAILGEPFLTIDGEVWTVEDFQRELAIHPLVFRKRKISRHEFAEQFKLAVADLIRDKFVTKEAYKRGLDRAPAVQQTVAMWKDYLLAQYAKNQLLVRLGKAEEFSRNYLKVIETVLNPVVDSLQQKYAPQIEINTDLFEKIPITRIDMFVLQRNVPFGVVVPSFPLITTDNRLDYGRKMVK